MAKKKGGKKGKGGKSSGSGPINFDFEDCPVDLSRYGAEMKTFIDYMTKAFSTIRVGRVSPDQIKNISVDAYDSPTPLGVIGQMSMRRSNTITIMVHDKTLVTKVTDALNNAGDFDLAIDNQTVHVTFPQVTAEYRKDLIKSAKKKSEETKNNIRNVRKKALDGVKSQSAELSEDEVFLAKEMVQVVTDQAIVTIEGQLARKEREIVEV